MVRWFRNLAISRIVAESLESLKTKFPPPTVDIDEIKQKYHAIAGQEGLSEEQAKPGSGKKGRKHKKGK